MVALVGETVMKSFGVFFLPFFFAAAAVWAQETNFTITVDGVTYSNVTWGTVTPATVSLFHETGVATILLEKLPPELQKRFGYDPEKAAQYRIAEAALQAESAKRLADWETQKKLAQQQEEEKEASAKRSQPQPPAQPPTMPVVGMIKFVTSEMQPSATSENRAILISANGGKTTVVFDSNGCDFLERCAAQRADWDRQQANLEKAKANAYVDPDTGAAVGDVAWSLPMPIFTVYAVQIDDSTYRLIGSREFIHLGGSQSFLW